MESSYDFMTPAFVTLEEVSEFLRHSDMSETAVFIFAIDGLAWVMSAGERGMTLTDSGMFEPHEVMFLAEILYGKHRREAARKGLMERSYHYRTDKELIAMGAKNLDGKWTKHLHQKRGDIS